MNAATAPGGRLLWLNSATAFALAGMVAVILHESSHAVAALALGDHDVRLYGYQVDFAEPRPTARAVATALVGPIFSLALGVVVILTTRNAGRGFVRLWWLWLGLISAQNFFGTWSSPRSAGSATPPRPCPCWAPRP